MAAAQPPNDAIVIGIDFGTTFSGVAWAYSKQPEEIEIVTSWDSELHHCSDVEKAPTQLHYDGNGGKVSWGYAIAPEKEPLKWFKLLLLDDRDLPPDVARSTQLQEARRLRNEANRDPIEIIASFLRKLWNHSLESIERSVGPDLLKRSNFQVVITLPAIWPPYAQQKMKQAAQESGILDPRPDAGTTTLRFVSEPEAAALATIKDLAQRSTIEAGDTITVCDAGGGTVDLISYIVESVEPFVAKECVKGDGDLCGGVFLDEGFIKLVEEKSPKGAWVSVSKADKKNFLNDQWEHFIKPQFENQQLTWPVDLPESCRSSSSKGLKRRETLELTSGEILSVFSPIADKIEALVSRQVNAIQEKHHGVPKYIILVGGFGRSRYLFNRLKARFQSTILQSRGTKPWTAICRGAVVQGIIRHNPSSGLGVNIQARVARMSYGVLYRTPFVRGVHDARDMTWDVAQQTYLADNQMEWFLREGDDISEKRSVHHDYFRLMLGHEASVKNTIYCSTTFPPPSRYDDSNTVRMLCEIKWERRILTQTLPKYTNSLGKSFPKLEHRIEMDCEDGIVNFGVRYKGSRVGEQDVEVQFN
ncbi:hypothetical protein NW762_000478 [Fusarium torreyae]|uniref:Hsp70 protein n=1 Tax=Fusarium torreyae TaxID=1237075 RepID=A0A9W8SJI4_9HYPO|nr:hypothetical protein NW762_000478 [Fusarium torreyae]